MAKLPQKAADGPFSVMSEFTAINYEAVLKTEYRFNQLAEIIIDHDNPNKGLITWCVARSMDDEKHIQSPATISTGQSADNVPPPKKVPKLYITQIYSNKEALKTYASDNAHEAFQPVYEDTEREGPKYLKHQKSVSINLDTSDDDGALCGITWHMGAKERYTLDGMMVNPRCLGEMKMSKKQRRWHTATAICGQSIMMELRIEPNSDDTSQLMEALHPFLEFGDMQTVVQTGFIINEWWKKHPGKSPTDKFSSNALVLYLIWTKPSYLSHMFSRTRMQKIFSCSKGYELTITSEDWNDPSLEDLMGHFEIINLRVHQRRKVVAGFLSHPAYSYAWKEKYGPKSTSSSSSSSSSTPKSKSKPKSQTPASTSKTKPTEPTFPKVPSPPPPTAQNTPLSKSKSNQDTETPKGYKFRRHPLTSNVDAIIFNKLPHSPPQPGIFSVPLLSIFRKLARLGHLEKEVPIYLCFGQLARLRNFQRSAVVFNKYSTSNLVLTDPNDRETVDRLADALRLLGYPLPSQEPVKLVLESLDEFIVDMEKEFASNIHSAKTALKTGGPVPYMALQEFYPIGSIVTTDSVGDLGGVKIALRVIDSYYEPIRSLLGGRKYSYRLGLEIIVALGTDYLNVTFEQLFDEWVGNKEQNKLIYKPVAPMNQLDPILHLRGKILKGLGFAPAYRRHKSGCFFPHLTKTKNLGAASTNQSLSGSGRVVIDPGLGLSLGHSPSSSADAIGLAISSAVRTFRQAMRSAPRSETEAARSQRFKQLGLSLSTSLPSESFPFCWPTVLAFSLVSKRWGHVLIDGLKEIPCDPNPWSQLVLPPRTKEILMSTAFSTLQGKSTFPTASSSSDVNTPDLSRLSLPPRYRMHDIIDGKSNGVLFLLYGPPGTGKTLSVEALSAYLGRPLYSISFAELGSTVSELEERLTNVLMLSAKWGCLVLLDEGDALVERREKGRLLLNSMTGVLLRLLENFEGALFITSNRIAEFDPAALSRVTLALKFEPLDANARATVWRNTLLRIFAFEQDQGGNAVRSRAEAETLVDSLFDFPKLAKFIGSGRSVNAIIRLAIGLAEHRQVSLSQRIVEDALKVFSDFNSHLLSEGVHTDWTH